MSISDRLDEIEARPVAWPFLDRADADKSSLLAALRAVLDLHSEIWHDGPRCNECSEPELDEPAEWPCPTVRAVEAALGEARDGL